MKSIFKFIKNLICLPKPSALPMRMFGASSEDYTWEDWEEENSKKYPIRYYLTETLPLRMRLFYRTYIDEPIYWLKCHTMFRHKHHLIDISNPGGGIDYEYGPIDVDQKFLACMGRIICDFIEKEKPFENMEWASEDQLNLHTECMALYTWWQETRPRMMDEYYRLRNEQALQEKDNEMIDRFLKIRHQMWR